jgi:hypothetical protein
MLATRLAEHRLLPNTFQKHSHEGFGDCLRQLLGIHFRGLTASAISPEDGYPGLAGGYWLTMVLESVSA